MIREVATRNISRVSDVKQIFNIDTKVLNSLSDVDGTSSTELETQINAIREALKTLIANGKNS